MYIKNSVITATFEKIVQILYADVLVWVYYYIKNDEKIKSKQYLSIAHVIVPCIVWIIKLFVII